MKLNESRAIIIAGIITGSFALVASAIVSLPNLLHPATASPPIQVVLPTPQVVLRFDDVKTAELQISDVDDFMTVWVNDHRVIQAQFGETPSWMSIKDYLRKGPNAIKVAIDNARYGGCGGALSIRLNGTITHQWAWGTAKGQTENRGSYINCYTEVMTVNLE